jgi:hypothetical protein
MLRHGCGYALANAGHDTRALQAWLGHKNIQHTVRYTELAPTGSKTFGAIRQPFPLMVHDASFGIWQITSWNCSPVRRWEPTAGPPQAAISER